MSRFSNKLSKGEAERLAILIEEAAEVQKIACKILRHGYDSYHPKMPGTRNREMLAEELGDLTASMVLIVEPADVDRFAVFSAAVRKIRSWRDYAHHQPSKLLDLVEAKLKKGRS